MADSTIRARVDESIKNEAQLVLHELGLTMSDAIRLFFHQVVIEKGLPFPVKLANDSAKSHDAWFREQVEEALVKANDPSAISIPHEKVRERMAKLNADLLAGKTKEQAA